MTGLAHCDEESMSANEAVSVEPTDMARGSHSNQVFGSFYLGVSEFAIPARDIKDVINAPDELMQQPLAPKYLVGILTLRGMIMPVIDVRDMFGIASCDQGVAQQKIAIIEYRQFHVGLLFDETGEVFRNQGGRLNFSPYERRGARTVTSGAFEFDAGQRIVQLLDTQAVIELEGNHLTRIVDAQSQSVDDQRVARGKRHQSISFRVGASELAIDIDNIQEIIQIDSLENAALAAGMCIGTTNLRGQTVPLVDLALLLGFESGLAPKQSSMQYQILVTQIHGMPIGLVVSEIADILHYFEDEIVSFPVISVRKPELFGGCLQASDGRQVLQLEIDSLLTNDEIELVTRGYSKLFLRQESSEDDGHDGAGYETQTYLTFDIDRLYALSILEILEVLDYPDELMRPPHQSSYFDGLINSRGELIGVINAWKLYGIESDAPNSEHIIIFRYEGNRFGLAIDSIRAIIHLQERNRQPLPSAVLNSGSEICADAKEAIAYTESSEASMQDMLILDVEAIGRRISAGV